jgi:tight adherence protein B
MVTGLVDSVVTAGREGRDPGAAERRRLLLAGAGAAFVFGTLVAGPALGLALAGAGPWVVARVLRARRERYRRAVDADVPGLALSLADALAGGHSLRGALAAALSSVGGATGHELRRTVAELAAGARTEDALEAMASRVRSPRLDTVVAACLLQRSAGGDLARLLRDGARAMEESTRLEAELRAATAQARFTGLLVVLLPLGGGLLAELASPGWTAALFSSFLTAWLVGIAVVLQVAAAVAIRRLGRVRR